MKIKQSATVLALFLSSSVSGIRTKSEEDSPFLIFSRNNWDGAPSRFNAEGSTFNQRAFEDDQEDAEQVVPIALALQRRGNHHRNQRQQQHQHQVETIPMFSQPSDFMS